MVLDLKLVLIAGVVWGITRLFPDRNQTSVPPPPQQHEDEDVAPPLIDSHRR